MTEITEVWRRHCSRDAPGKIVGVVLTGTPSGTGFFREPKAALRPGDVVEIEVEGIRLISNPAVAG